MKLYVMSYDYGDGSAGPIFCEKIPDEDELEEYEFDSMIGNLGDGTWITLPDDLDLEAAGIRLWKGKPRDSG